MMIASRIYVIVMFNWIGLIKKLSKRTWPANVQAPFVWPALSLLPEPHRLSTREVCRPSPRRRVDAGQGRASPLPAPSTVYGRAPLIIFMQHWIGKWNQIDYFDVALFFFQICENTLDGVDNSHRRICSMVFLFKWNLNEKSVWCTL
jgi:hypothetical protein